MYPVSFHLDRVQNQANINKGMSGQEERKWLGGKKRTVRVLIGFHSSRGGDMGVFAPLQSTDLHAHG